MAMATAKRATAREKRRNKLAVKVAKDLLKNLRFYKHVEGGSYCLPVDDIAESDIKTTKDARKQCRVCAMGALFVEAMHINGSVFAGAGEKILNVVNRCDQDTGIIAALSPAFSSERLRNIEMAFEEGWHSDSVASWRGVDGSRQRLRDILKWIIKHKGEFPPRH